MLHVDDGDAAIRQHDGALPRCLASAGVHEVEAAVVGHVEQHPLPHTRHPANAHQRRPVQPRSAPASLVTPRVVAEERVRHPVELGPPTAGLHPPLALAGDLVGDPLADQPAVDPGELRRVLIRQRGAPARHVRGYPVLVVLQDQAHGLQRLNDLQPQRPYHQGVQVGPQPPGEPDVVLLTRGTDAHEAVQDVVVLVQTHGGGQPDLAGHVAEADVVPVVPGRIRPRHPREGRGDLVVRVLVHPDQHAGPSK